MSALVVLSDDGSADWYVNSSRWVGFLESYLEPVHGELRNVLDRYVSVIGVDFTGMDEGDPAIVGSWLEGAIRAEIETETSAESKGHLIELRDRLSTLLPHE